ncbi:MAG: hypothetical protein ABFD75_03735 [Smithella sp.]
MTLYIYSTRTNEAEERLLRIIELFIPEKELKFYRNIDDFSKQLRQPAFNSRIAVLLVSSESELQDIITIQELLEDSKIILIIPDTNPATLARGHTLRPRFLCDCNSDFVNVAAVLCHMLRKLGQDRQPLLNRAEDKKQKY